MEGDLTSYLIAEARKQEQQAAAQRAMMAEIDRMIGWKPLLLEQSVLRLDTYAERVQAAYDGLSATGFIGSFDE